VDPDMVGAACRRELGGLRLLVPTAPPQQPPRLVGQRRL